MLVSDNGNNGTQDNGMHPPDDVPCLLTTDGEYVEWPFAPPSVTTIALTSAEVRALRDPSSVRRILAHASLTRSHIARLYARPRRGVRLRRVAKRIIELDIEDLCEGIGETRICAIVTDNREGPAIRAMLLAAPIVRGERPMSAWLRPELR